jgi:hypothetical protein
LLPLNTLFGKMMMRTVLLLAMLTGESVARALDTNYSPFSSAEMVRVSATRATSTTGAELVATFVKTADDAAEFRLAVGGKTVLTRTVDVWLEHTKTIIADLDGNGMVDVAKEAYHGTQGLCLGCELMIFSQYASGKFSVITIPSERVTPDDICDLDNDGQKEILTCVLVGCEGHNYWVYRCWHSSGQSLVSVDGQYGFPRAVWFTNRPNHRLVPHDLLKKIMANYPEITPEGKTQPNEQMRSLPGSRVPADLRHWGMRD